jgi:hypothetical protein
VGFANTPKPIAQPTSIFGGFQIQRHASLYSNNKIIKGKSESVSQLNRAVQDSFIRIESNGLRLTRNAMVRNVPVEVAPSRHCSNQRIRLDNPSAVVENEEARWYVFRNVVENASTAVQAIFVSSVFFVT